MADILSFGGPHKRSYHSLAELPQRGSVAESAFGVGWWELDQIFKFYAGQFVVVTGIAGQGKSTFMFNCVAKLALEKGVKSFLYVPENEGYLREKFRLLWPGSKDSFEHFCESQCFIRSSVHGTENVVRTMQWVLGEASQAVADEGVELVMIDPWNELDRAKPKDMLLSDYIGRCLMEVKDFCRCTNASVVVVAHPTKAVNEHGGSRTPNLSDIEGSMNWFNKCDNGLIVARDPDMSTARVISAKVREIGAGKIGVCHFNVDPKTGVFTPMEGGVSL